MVGYFQTLPCLSLFVDNFVNVCSLWYRFLVHMHMLRLDFLSVKTTVSLVFNKIPSVFRTWKNCEFVCKNKLNYFVLKVSILRDFAV